MSKAKSFTASDLRDPAFTLPVSRKNLLKTFWSVAIALTSAEDKIKILEAEKALQAETIEELKKELVRDELTGLYNRKLLNTEISNIHKVAQTMNLGLATFVIDIDHFKSINDKYGHEIGDAVLVHISSLLQREIHRPLDRVVRYGGEEILIVMDASPRNEGKTKSPQQIAEFAEHLRSVIANSPLTLDDGKIIHTTASIGVATYNPRDNSETLKEQIIRTDHAMYYAKGVQKDGKTVDPNAKGGRNRVCFDDGYDSHVIVPHNPNRPDQQASEAIVGEPIITG